MKELEAEFGLTVGQIATLCGVSSSAVSQWFGSGKKPITEIGSVRAAVRLERRTGWSALWIAYGEGPKIIGAAASVLSGALPLVAALSTLAATLDELSEDQRTAVAERLKALATAPDSPKVLDALHAALVVSGEIAPVAQRRSNGN